MWFTKSEDDRAERVAIVTGGSRGIGLAAARAFLGQGARVAICGVDPERLREARAGLETLGEVEAVEVDVRVISQVQAFVERVIASGLWMFWSTTPAGRRSGVLPRKTPQASTPSSMST